MKADYTHIEVLIARFFDGATTNEEEQQLYAFFAGDDIPKHLEEYKPVFTYFDTQIAGEIDPTTPVYPYPVEEQKSTSVWIRWAAVAASFLLIASFSIYQMEKDEFDPLEGSYIIRNGVKVTDLDEIRPELEASMQAALLQEAKAEQLFSQLREPDNEFVTVQQHLQQQYCQILSQFTDRTTREEVEKILEIKCND